MWGEHYSLISQNFSMAILAFLKNGLKLAHMRLNTVKSQKQKMFGLMLDVISMIAI